MRIDDETLGIPLVSTAPGAFAGELINPRGCYICKNDYTLVDAFYHYLCPSCAAMSHAKRGQGTDLTGRRALLTGGRAKIGMYIALRLLRDGAHTTITTRFPHDAVRRFSALEDSADWIDRLKIVGIDLRDPTQVIALADEVAAAGPLDILINNACQTVRRTPGSYAPLVEAELAPLPTGIALPEIVSFDRISEAHPAAIAGTLQQHAVAHHETPAHTPASITALALKAGNASLEAHLAGTAVDAGGLLPDLQTTNSWTQTVDEVDPLELLEVQLCNATAPFLLISRLRASLRSSPARRTYVVNVSAMEGQFARSLQGSGAPAHQHGQGVAQHADPHQRGRDVRDRQHPDERRRHRLDHRRAAAPGEAADRGRGLARAARPGRRRGPRLRPDRARRGRRGPLRPLPEGLRSRAEPLVSCRRPRNGTGPGRPVTTRVRRSPCMTTIGFIGSGNIGGTLAKLFAEQGHDVVISNSRGPETLADLVSEIGDRARAATAAEAAEAGEVVVVSIPFLAVDQVPVAPLAGKVVIDTNNYYFERDGHVAEIDDGGTTPSEVLQAHLPESQVVKLFNAIQSGHLATQGAARRHRRPPRAPDRRRRRRRQGDRRRAHRRDRVRRRRRRPARRGLALRPRPAGVRPRGRRRRAHRAARPGEARLTVLRV